MALSFVGLAVLVALPLLLGAAALRALGIAWRTDPLGYPGWAWLVGALLLAGLELLHLVTGLGSPWPLAVVALILAALLYGAGRGQPSVEPEPRTSESAAARAWFAFVLVFLLLVTMQRVLGASWNAIVREDEAIFWSKRAKLWFLDGGFGPHYAQAMADKSLANGGYPFLNPLLELFVFDLAGRITHVVNRVPIQLCSFALLLCTASALRRATSSWLAGLMLVLLASTSVASSAARHAHSDVLVALGALTAFDALRRWRASGARAWLGLASLAAAFLIWSKNEGLLILAAFLLAAGLAELRAARSAWRRPSRAQLAWLPILAVLAVTTFHNEYFQATSDHAPALEQITHLVQDLRRNTGVVLSAFAAAAVHPDLNAIPAVFLGLLLLAPGARRGQPGVLALALVGVHLALMHIYLTKPDLSRLLGITLDRVLFQLLPLQLLWIAVVLRDLQSEPVRAPAAPAGATRTRVA